MELTGQNGEIVLENKDLIKNDVNISNKFGKITLKLRRKVFILVTEFGSIKVILIFVNEDLNKQQNTIGNGDISIKVENERRYKYKNFRIPINQQHDL